MKKILIACMVTFITTVQLCAQILPDLAAVNLDSKEAFKAAEPIALQAADYVMALPVDDESMGRQESMQFLMKWMEGSPDCNFRTVDNLMEPLYRNASLLNVFMAAACKYIITNKSTDDYSINLNAARIFIIYITDTAHHVKLNSGLKKLVEAEKKDELKSFLKLPVESVLAAQGPGPANCKITLRLKADRTFRKNEVCANPSVEAGTFKVSGDTIMLYYKNNKKVGKAIINHQAIKIPTGWFEELNFYKNANDTVVYRLGILKNNLKNQ